MNRPDKTVQLAQAASYVPAILSSYGSSGPWKVLGATFIYTLPSLGIVHKYLHGSGLAADMILVAGCMALLVHREVANLLDRTKPVHVYGVAVLVFAVSAAVLAVV